MASGRHREAAGAGVAREPGTGQAVAPPDDAPPRPASGILGSWRDAPWLRSRWLTAAMVLVVACLLYLAYLGEARTLGIDSDGSSNVLQAWDMLHGNLLLRGWWLSDVSFYTTELPEYMIVELVHGMNATTTAAAAAATYTLTVLLAAALSWGRVGGRAGLTRALVAAGIMFCPGSPPDAGVWLSSPDHAGTMVPLLAIWLAVDWFADSWMLPLLVGAALPWVEIADQLAVLVGAVPLAVVSVTRLLQRRRSWRMDAALLAAAVASVPAADLVTRLIRSAGGYVVYPVALQRAHLASLSANFSHTGLSLLQNFGADVVHPSGGALALVSALLHLAGLALAAWGLYVGARRLLRGEDRVVPILVTGLLVNVASYLLTMESLLGGTNREIVSVLPYGAVLAGRLLPGLPQLRRLLPALLAVAVGYAGTLGYYATRPPAQQRYQQQVVSWLEASHLDSGIGDYWTANVTTVASAGRVRVRAVQLLCGRFAPYAWETRKSWYYPPQQATFALLARSPGTVPPEMSSAVAQFGRPQRTKAIGTFEVLVWDRNLLPAVNTPGPGCSPPSWRR